MNNRPKLIYETTTPGCDPGITMLWLLIQFFAQDTPVLPDGDKVASRYLDAVTGKSASISSNIDRQTSKYLERFQRREASMYKKLAKKDSAAAAKALLDSKKQYQALQQKLTCATQKISYGGKKYMPMLDTVATSLKFFRQYGDFFKKGLASSEQLTTSLSEVNGVQDKLQQADDVQSFIRARREQLTNQLQQAGMEDVMKSFNKDVYYYSAQMREYREALNNPGKAEQKAIALLNQLPVFRNFMQQNNQLAALFGVPGGGGNASDPVAMTGLQVRAQVQQLMQNQMAAGGPNVQGMIQQNIQAAQAQMNTLKDKISKLGTGTDMDMPGFKPNQQKTKTFLQRVEYGANMQTQKSGYFFPTTTDLALSVGYKLNDRSTIGIGTSYKMGWGKDIQHIAISHQGIGFRSFADIKIKASFYASGGFEYNFQQPFESLQSINKLDKWSKSGLIGISKIVSVKSSMFKKTKLQLLWDFLSYQQKPVSQPIKFRVGYTF